MYRADRGEDLGVIGMSSSGLDSESSNSLTSSSPRKGQRSLSESAKLRKESSSPSSEVKDFLLLDPASRVSKGMVSF